MGKGEQLSDTRKYIDVIRPEQQEKDTVSVLSFALQAGALLFSISLSLGSLFFSCFFLCSRKEEEEAEERHELSTRFQSITCIHTNKEKNYLNPMD